MFNKSKKTARIEAIFREDASNKQRMQDIPGTNLKDVPMKTGNVAEKVKNLQAEQERQ